MFPFRRLLVALSGRDTDRNLLRYAAMLHRMSGEARKPLSARDRRGRLPDRAPETCVPRRLPAAGRPLRKSWPVTFWIPFCGRQFAELGPDSARPLLRAAPSLTGASHQHEGSELGMDNTRSGAGLNHAHTGPHRFLPHLRRHALRRNRTRRSRRPRGVPGAERWNSISPSSPSTKWTRSWPTIAITPSDSSSRPSICTVSGSNLSSSIPPMSPRSILRIAMEQSCDLIVMATRGRSPSAAVLLGSETEHCLMATPIPLLAVKHFGARLSLLQALRDQRFRKRGEERFT